ncbi:hypothetical protein GOODEAATRI_024268 [Goodea atripinnis]|uniref:Cytochrome b reductase 1 n=1 Tax=Goodea atripinnis TaxID=208336 RepID=A0ABV0Q0L7_9TELE
MAMENMKQFLFALSAAGAFGFVAIIFVLRWVLHFKEGLAWDGGLAEFNWHPVLIVTGFIFLQGIGKVDDALIPRRLKTLWLFGEEIKKTFYSQESWGRWVLALKCSSGGSRPNLPGGQGGCVFHVDTERKNGKKKQNRAMFHHLIY